MSDPTTAPAGTGRQLIDRLVAEALDAGVSDIHLKEGQVPRVRARNKAIVETSHPPLDTASMRAIFSETTPQKDLIHHYEERGECDYSFSTPRGRVRANVYRQGGQMSMALRVIKPGIATFEQLGLDRPMMEKIAANNEGLILVTGPTGSGA